MDRTPSQSRRMFFAERTWLRRACAIFVLMLAGCKSLPTMPPLDASTPQQWRNASPAGRDGSLPAPDLAGWWHAFRDTELDALVTQALAGNLTVAQANERLMAAHALASASRSDFRPNVHTGTVTAPDPDATTSYLQGNIDALWDLGLFGRRQSTQWIAQAGVDTAAADLQAARVTLVAEVARDYLALRGAQRQVALSGEAAEAQRSRRALMQRRRDLGLASDSDLARADADVAQADAMTTEPRLRADASAQQLAVLCGRTEPQPELLASAAPPKLVEEPPVTLPADLLRTRPDIKRAEAAVLAAAGELGVARADLYPRFSLVGAITSATTTAGGEFGFGRAVTSLGPGIDLPLFDWGARRSRVKAKDAELSALIYAYRETVLESLAETETALAAWQAQHLRVVNLRSALAARERDAQGTTHSRRLGLADDLDLASSAIALTQSQLELLDAQQAQALAYVALFKALGGAPPLVDAVR